MFDKNKYYKSADIIPIYNFNECRKGNLQYLYKCDIDEVPEKYPDSFNQVWIELLYTLKYVDVTLLRILEQSAKYENMYAVTKDKKWLNKKNLREAEYFRQIESSKENKDDFDAQVIAIEKYLRREVNIFTCPTNKYYGYLLKLKSNG